MEVILACISDLCHRSADNVTTRISTVPSSPVTAIPRHFLYDTSRRGEVAPAAFLARLDAVRPVSSGPAPAPLRHRSVPEARHGAGCERLRSRQTGLVADCG